MDHSINNTGHSEDTANDSADINQELEEVLFWVSIVNTYGWCLKVNLEDALDSFFALMRT